MAMHMNDQASEEERYEERSRPPCFCKTVSEYSMEGGPCCWMQVPPEFVGSYLPHVDRMRTVLQNAEGETWLVQYLAEHGFVTGWAEFATGNALAVGDTLVFSFVEDGKNFVVQVFNSSGCEKGTQQRKDLSPPPIRSTHDPSGKQAEICKFQSRSAPSRTQAGPRNVAKAMGKRCDPARRNSRAQKQARALVTKARLRKMNFTPPKRQQQQRKKQKRGVGESDDGEIGLDAASGYHGERGGGRSSLDSLRWDETEAAADLRAFAESGLNHRRFRRDDVDVQPPRRLGRPRKVPPRDSSAVVTEKRKSGRPLKHQAPGGSSDLTSIPLRDIFVSRRRKVTQAECELALDSAHQLASQLHASTTCIIVMRQSFVYRNFVLCVPRPFAKRYMPDTNREVALLDSAWNAWFGAWNVDRKCISGGWRDFALEHCLEEDDALVLEIVEDDPQVLTLKVHLFPVVPVPEGVTHVCPPDASFLCSEEWNSTGVPIDPNVLCPVGTIQPRRQRPRKRRVHRKHVYTCSDSSENVFTSSSSDSSVEFD